MISDGAFDDGLIAPQSNTVGISTPGVQLPGGARFCGQSEALRPGQTAEGLTFRYFEPEVRDEYRPGAFAPGWQLRPTGGRHRRRSRVSRSPIRARTAGCGCWRCIPTSRPIRPS